MIVVEFGDGTRTIRFERFDLRQVSGVDQHKTGGRSHKRRNQRQQTEQNAAHELASGNLARRKLIVGGLHWGLTQDSTSFASFPFPRAPLPWRAPDLLRHVC